MHTTEESPALGGRVIRGRYRLEGPIGYGAHGAIFRATQLGINRSVAVKILSAPPEAKGARKRFDREAVAISKLRHPNIVEVFDFGFDEELNFPFMVLELIEGSTLGMVIEEHGGLPERRTARLIGQVAGALLEAHAQEIVHRDLKPDNIMVTRLRDGREHLTVLDFGIAKITGGTDHLTGLTAPGSVLGTPHYLSPEQAVGAAVDFRSDLYSLGCVLYAALAAQAPFHGKDVADLLAAHRSQPAPALPDRLVDGTAPSTAISELTEALLAKTPTARPTGADVVAEILLAIADGDPVNVQERLSAARRARFEQMLPPGDSLATEPRQQLQDVLQDSSKELVVPVDHVVDDDDDELAPVDPSEADPLAPDMVADTVPASGPFDGSMDSLPEPKIDDVPQALLDPPEDKTVPIAAVTPMSEPTALVADTNLSTNTLSEPKKSKWYLVIGGVVVFALLGLLITSLPQSSSPSAPVEKAASKTEKLSPAVAQRPAPDRIYRLRTRPEGATVLFEGKNLGLASENNPVEVQVPGDRTKPVVVQVRMPGYRTRRVEIVERTQLIRLTRASTRGRRKTKKKPRFKTY